MSKNDKFIRYTPKQPSRFRTKYWSEINDESGENIWHQLSS